MTGVILCGGQSSRMGKDKGSLMINGVTWAGLAAEKFAALPLPYVCSVAAHHQNPYNNLFPLERQIEDEPDLPVGGPLKGILSVHKRMPGEDLFVLAVDMPLITKAILKALMLTAKEGTHKAYVFQNGSQIEPLCAVYTAAALQQIASRLAAGTLNRFCMHYILGLIQTKIITVDANAAAFFFNCNTPDDLQKL